MRWRVVRNIMAIFVCFARTCAQFALKPALHMLASTSIVRNAKRHVKPAQLNAKSMQLNDMRERPGF
jgi:hypothetical protein